MNNHDIIKYNMKWLQSNIRLIQQKFILFQDIIFQNIIKDFINEQ